MARYKYIDTNPHFLSVDLARELLPGAFEHAVNHLLDHELDLPHFDDRFRNDATGASAYPPAMLLKVVLFAYSQGIVRSRAIERLGPGARDVHSAVREDRPALHQHRALCQHAARRHRQVFAAVLAVCDGQGLIGREMFAIDGVKLPSNALKHRSGTRAEFTQRAEKLQAAAQMMLDRHRATDAHELDVAQPTQTRRAQRTNDRSAVCSKQCYAGRAPEGAPTGVSSASVVRAARRTY